MIRHLVDGNWVKIVEKLGAPSFPVSFLLGALLLVVVDGVVFDVGDLLSV
jgi:hypothetical protein